MTVPPEKAKEIAESWIAAWNSHTLEAILALYSEDFEMSSPNIIRRSIDPSGTLKGKAKVAQYWKAALDQYAAEGKNLQFKLSHVTAGVGSVGLIYVSTITNHTVIELFRGFDANWKITKAEALYMV